MPAVNAVGINVLAGVGKGYFQGAIACLVGAEGGGGFGEQAEAVGFDYVNRVY